jgi:hypothetical protein
MRSEVRRRAPTTSGEVSRCSTARRDAATARDESEVPTVELEADENGPPSAAQIFPRQRASAARSCRAAEAPGGPKGRGHCSRACGSAPRPSNVGGRVSRYRLRSNRNAKPAAGGHRLGGLWISEDRRDSWRANHDFLPNLSVTAIVVRPGEPRVVVPRHRRGERGPGRRRRLQVHRRRRHLAVPRGDQRRRESRLALREPPRDPPAQPQVLLAALTNNDRTGGRSTAPTDGGATWTRVSR